MEQRGGPGSAGRGGRRQAGPWGLLLALCLVLAPALPPPVRALPPPGPHHPPDRLNRSREMLEAANTSPQRLQELSILEFKCILEEADLDDITKNQTNTIKACIPEDPGRKCLQAIYEDLSAYRAELRNLSNQQVLATIDKMMEALQGSGRSGEQPEVGRGLPLPIGEQLRLCSILHTFRTRALTITRLMSFFSSQESSF
ncbi:interleukin-12 subunit alpha [Apus apus]|uniref:interleukin-12 subunit alpha n=1 Tax=Apus apus TaxID=8895 RepID=UPI0021F836BB|nr:interleukin-12 subunit alpha [Apus apus]